MFFPNGTSCKGAAKNLNISLAGIDNIVLEDSVIVENNGDTTKCAFSTDKYIEQYGIKTAKFHILSDAKPYHKTNIYHSRYGEEYDSLDDLYDFEIPRLPPLRSLEETPTVNTITTPNIMSLPGAVFTPISVFTPMSMSPPNTTSAALILKPVCVIYLKYLVPTFLILLN